jgi:hypothetical protein
LSEKSDQESILTGNSWVDIPQQNK